MTETVENVDVAIVGGGFAGSMVAAHLLVGGQGPLRVGGQGPLRVALVERQLPPGRGVAYGTPEPMHLLNIPASEMSAWPDDPDHFVRWLEARGESGAYAPRGLYGAYVEATLKEAAAAPGERSLTLIEDEAIGLLPAGPAYRLRLRSGRILLARRVVVAIGQFAPAPLRAAEPLSGSEAYVDDPWQAAALRPMEGGQALLVGTGLTAVDVAVTLLARGADRVILVSRKAQLPAAQYEGPPYRDWLDPASAPARVLPLFARVKAELRAAARSDIDWRAVIDAMKPHTPALWARLPLVERRRFVRHVRSFYEAARNRLPPPTAARVAAALAAGRMAVVAGRLTALEPAGAGAVATVLRRGGGSERLEVARVVNCTGPDPVYRRINHPLVLDLIGTGLARYEPLGLGLDVAPDGRLKDEDGLAARPIYTLGWPRQGQLWEATTVPSLRVQAKDVAARVLTD